MAKAIQAGIYCRLSLARTGDTTKVDDQERICRRLTRQLGWEVAQVYTDNSRSAWRDDRKRPGWDAMLGDVEAGKLQAIVVYHGDRLIRQPEDLVRLLKLAKYKGVRLASPTGTRDLDNADDQFVLEIEASMAKRESANISRRMKADIARRQARGVVNSGGRGGRTFGFGTDGVTSVPREAAIVRDVYARALAGEGIRHIATELAGRGVTTTAGKLMHPMAVKRMLVSPRYAGLMLDGASAAAWEPVVSREDWEQARALIKGGMFLPGHTARKYLLSGIARCSECGRGLNVLTAYTRSTGKTVPARYGCLHPECRKVFRDLRHLDTYVTVRTVLKLSDAQNPPGRIPSAPGLAAELRALAEERQAIEVAITDHTKGHLHLLLGRLESADKRLAQLRELTAADSAARLTAGYAGITEGEFNGLPLSVRRALVAACFTITVLPASKRGPGFRTEDVRLGKP